jgi:hypothetical protein
VLLPTSSSLFDNLLVCCCWLELQERTPCNASLQTGNNIPHRVIWHFYIEIPQNYSFNAVAVSKSVVIGVGFAKDCSPAEPVLLPVGDND